MNKYQIELTEWESRYLDQIASEFAMPKITALHSCIGKGIEHYTELLNEIAEHNIAQRQAEGQDDGSNKDVNQSVSTDKPTM